MEAGSIDSLKSSELTDFVDLWFGDRFGNPALVKCANYFIVGIVNDFRFKFV